jgi:hypothetical protein
MLDFLRGRLSTKRGTDLWFADTSTHDEGTTCRVPVLNIVFEAFLNTKGGPIFTYPAQRPTCMVYFTHSHAVLDTHQCGQVTFFSSSASSSMASWPPSLMGPRSYKGGRRLPTPVSHQHDRPILASSLLVPEDRMDSMTWAKIQSFSSLSSPRESQ